MTEEENKALLELYKNGEPDLTKLTEEQKNLLAKRKNERAEEIRKWNEAHIARLAKRATECIQKQDLVDGAYYEGHCRNARVARWFAAQDRFTYWREKFGCVFLEDINHPADDIGFDIFYPKAKIDEPTDKKKRIPQTAIEQFKKAYPDK